MLLGVVGSVGTTALLEKIGAYVGAYVFYCRIFGRCRAPEKQPENYCSTMLSPFSSNTDTAGIDTVDRTNTNDKGNLPTQIHYNTDEP